MTLRSKPTLQGITANAQNKLAGTFAQVGIKEISPILSAVFSVDSLLSDVSWFVVNHTQLGGAQEEITFDPVPPQETWKIPLIAARQSQTATKWEVKVTYPQQGGAGLHGDPLPSIYSITTGRTSLISGDMANLFTSSVDTNANFPLIPLEIFPGGVLSVKSEQDLVIGETTQVGFVIQIGSPPNTSQQQVIGNPVVVEV